MKKIIFCMGILLLFLTPLSVNAADYQKEIDNIAEQYNIEEIVNDFSFNNIFEYIKNTAEEKSVQPLKITLRIIGICGLYSLCMAVSDNKLNHTVSVLNNICTLTVFINLLEPIQSIVRIVAENMYAIKNFMVSFLPVFSGISMASGEFASSTIYTGLFFTAMIFISDFSVNAILPTLNIYFALIISNSSSSFIKLNSICVFYIKAVKAIMKCFVSVICFMLTVQTTLTRGKDTLAVKAGKLVAGSAIPIIGSTLKDAIGSVYAGMEVIKGYAGAVGLIGIVTIFIPSLINLGIYWLCTNTAFIVSDIFETNLISTCLKGFIDVIELMVSIVFLYMIMLVFSLAIMISITNGV